MKTDKDVKRDEEIKFLYKYYSPKKHNFDAVRDGEFFFSKVSKLNDPFDASFKLIEPYTKFIEKVICTSDPKEQQKRREKAKELMENYGTCSFSENKDNKHLWALYADTYKGFVIGYDKNTLDKMTTHIHSYCHLHKIDYREELLDLENINAEFTFKDETLSIKDCDDFHSAEQLFEYLCFCKEAKIWKAENEWRLFVGKNINTAKSVKSNKDGYFIPFPKEAVKSIIVGHNMEEEHWPYICAIAREYGIRTIYQTRPTTENKQWEIIIEERPFFDCNHCLAKTTDKSN